MGQGYVLCPVLLDGAEVERWLESIWIVCFIRN